MSLLYSSLTIIIIIITLPAARTLRSACSRSPRKLEISGVFVAREGEEDEEEQEEDIFPLSPLRPYHLIRIASYPCRSTPHPTCASVDSNEAEAWGRRDRYNKYAGAAPPPFIARATSLVVVGRGVRFIEPETHWRRVHGFSRCAIAKRSLWHRESGFRSGSCKRRIHTACSIRRERW